MTGWNEKSTSFRHAKQYFLCELSLERHLTHSTHNYIHNLKHTQIVGYRCKQIISICANLLGKMKQHYDDNDV